MTVKENLIRMIIDMDDSVVKTLEEYANQLLWERIMEEEASPEEIEIFEKSRSGGSDYVPMYSLELVLSDRQRFILTTVLVLG